MLIRLKTVKLANKDTGELYEFVTYFDTKKDGFTYAVIFPNDNNRFVTKVEGNSLFVEYIKHKDVQKVIVERTQPIFNYIWNGGHYVVIVDNDKYCSCDTVQECLEEIEYLKARLCL